MALLFEEGHAQVGLAKQWYSGRFDIGRMNKSGPNFIAINADLSNRGGLRSAFVPLAAKQGTRRNVRSEFHQKPSTNRRDLFRGPAVATWGGSTACRTGDHATQPGEARTEHEIAPAEQNLPRALVPGTDAPLPPQCPPDSETWALLSGIAILAWGGFVCWGALFFLGDMVFFMFVYLLIGAVLMFSGMQLIKTTGPSRARFRPREAGLPPDWHNLYEPTTGRPFYYNTATGTARWEPPALLLAPVGGGSLLGYAFHGVWLQLTELVAPVATTGLYYSLLRTALWCFRSCFGPTFMGVNRLTRLWLSALLLVLPVPLPSLILQLSSLESARLSPGAPLPTAVEAALCFVLPLSLLPNLPSFLKTARAAARARLPYRMLAWDAPSLVRLAAATCPAFAWLTKPSALRLSFSRVVFLPLPFGYLLRVPVPRWELLGRSSTGILFAATMAFPLARMVAAGSGDAPSVLKALWESKAVRMGVFVSVSSHLMDRQRDAYVGALEESSADKDGVSEMMDDLEKKAFEEFDRKLGDGTPS